MRSSGWKRPFLFSGGLAALIMAVGGPAWAFNSVQVVSVSAGAIVAGASSPSGASQLNLTHTPATNAYPLSRILIIQGSATDDSNGGGGSIIRFAGSLAPGRDTLRVTITFRIAGTTDNQTLTEDVEELSLFSFSIPREYVTRAGVEYRIDVTNLTTGTTASYPSDDPSEFQFVSVGDVSACITTAGGRVVYNSGVPDSLTTYAKTSLDIPAGALNESTCFTIEEIATYEIPSAVPPAVGRFTLDPSPIVAYRITPETRFNLPVTLTLIYPTDGANRLLGTSFDESRASAFAFDGFRWGPASARQSRLSHSFTTRIMHLSTYGVFASVPIQPEDFRPPQKIITPNGDSANDTLEFGNLDADATIDIYDVTGRRIRHLQGVFIWDGRDESGVTVESGVYIYQFKKDGSLVSGVVGVAK